MTQLITTLCEIARVMVFMMIVVLPGGCLLAAGILSWKFLRDKSRKGR